MTDYWKSNPRKFCNFCKCWISDNKASITFHENGKRHQTNVAKRLSDISSQNEKEERERKKMDSEIRKMEEAAMRSYAQDIHAKRDITAKNISTVMDNSESLVSTAATDYKVSQAQCEKVGPSTKAVPKRQIDPLRLAGDDADENGKFGHHRPGPNTSADSKPASNSSLWVEAKTEDNYTYYWNVKTNESVWEKPEEGFLSWKEFQKINDIAIQQQETQQAEKDENYQKNLPEMLARCNRERLKLLRPATASSTATDASTINNYHKINESVDGKPNYRTQEEAATPAIGQWQVVETKPTLPPPPIDLGLPKVKQPAKYIPINIGSLENPKDTVPSLSQRFKEKIIDHLDPEVAENIPASFKKRKISSKRNARQRLDGDD